MKNKPSFPAFRLSAGKFGAQTPLMAFLRKLPLYVILTAFALLYLEPVLYMVSMSFKSATDITDATAKWIPHQPTLTSVRFAFDAMNVWPAFLSDRGLWENLLRSNLFVSALTTFLPALIQIYTCAIAGYAFARLNFPCKRFLFVLLLLSYIVPPQTVAMTAAVTAAGKEMSQRLQEATLAPGKKYSINMIVNPENIQIVLAGEIEDWTDGGELQPDNEPVAIQFEEKLEEGYFTYDNVKYNVVKMKDGKWWMAQNLAYLPEGCTPATDLSAVTAGVFAPLKVNADQSGLEFTTDEAVVAANGYLYQAEVALGLNVGDLQTVAEAEALEGAQGICPSGWHVPTIDDITGLVGKAVTPIPTNAEAPYYNGSNGSIALLNADGFNMAPAGAISIQDNTKTAGTFMGWNTKYPDKITSSMLCGSSYAGVTYNTSGDETSGIKNLQFFGLMPMTNKDAETDFTCNGTKVSYRIAGPVRCVRN